jgi:hypothetical protein
MAREVFMLEGLKNDAGKLQWHTMPKVVLIPLVAVFVAGLKYGLYNCLKDFKDGETRFADALDRHLVACQMNPLEKDPEDGCYHLAKVAWYALMRIYHAEKEAGREHINDLGG